MDTRVTYQSLGHFVIVINATYNLLRLKIPRYSTIAGSKGYSRTFYFLMANG